MTPSHASTSKPCCSCSRIWAATGILVLFLCATIVMLRWSPEPMNEDAERALLREKNLAELQKSNQELLENYGWKDQSHGILHIPIQRAMEIEIATLNATKPHAVYAIAPNDLVPTPAGIPKDVPATVTPVTTSSPAVKK